MDAQTIELVQTSFLQLVPRLDLAERMFFQRLHELDPVLQPAVAPPPTDQTGLTPALLASLIGALPRLDELLAQLQRATFSQTSKQSLEEHYLAVGAALVWTLERMLDGEFDLMLRLAWLEAYTTVVALLAETLWDRN